MNAVRRWPLPWRFEVWTSENGSIILLRRPSLHAVRLWPWPPRRLS